MVDQIGQTLQQHVAHAGITVRERVQPGGHHGQRFGRLEMAAHAAAVVARELQRQRLDQRHRHAHLAGIAITGVDAIDGRAVGQPFTQELRAALDAIAPGGVGIQPHRLPAMRNGDHVFDRQAAVADHNGVLAGGRMRWRGYVQIVFSHGRHPSWGSPKNRRS